MMVLDLSRDFLFVFFSVLISWLLANFLKPFLNKEISFKEIFSKDGGMPSAHTTPASALMFSIFLSQGFSLLLVFSMVFLIAIMRDAVGVRYASGQNAIVLKKVVKKIDLKETVLVVKGHTNSQVLAGLFLGFFTTIILYGVFF